MNINLVTHNLPSTARVESGADNKTRPGGKPGNVDDLKAVEKPGFVDKPRADDKPGTVDQPRAGNKPGAADKPIARDGARDAVGTPVARDSKANAAPERPTGEIKSAGKASVRVELKIHEATGRIVGRVVDASTHKVVRELPPEELLRYLEATRKMFDNMSEHDLGQAIDKRV